MLSVLNGLEGIALKEVDIVLVHDAARCFATQGLISKLIRDGREYGAVIPGNPATSTVKVCAPDGTVLNTPDRSALYEIQTPQVFRGSLLKEAYRKAAASGFEATDDASVVEKAGIPVRVVPGERNNIKITTQEDLMYADALLRSESPVYRIGTGYDVHQLVPERKLILCGVCIPHETGLLGHSDADVAAHALMDAMLGALSLGDIGRHFPDSDDRWKGISSLILLKETACLIRSAGYRLQNADITIVAQRPKLAPYLPQMRKNVADVLECDPDQISVKATTTERLGFEGRMEGISAQAVCLLVSR